MRYFRRNLVDITISLLVICMAYLSSKVIANSPGMSVSRWIFMLAPVVAIGITIGVIKISSQAGYNIRTFLGFSPPGLDKRALGAFIVLAAVLGVFIVLNPFDFIMPAFIGITISLFLMSVYMILNRKAIDAIGLLLFSLPFIGYAEDQIVKTTGFEFDWITIKTALIMLFVIINIFVNIFMYKKPLAKGKLDAFVLLFAVVTLFSAFFSENIGFSLKRWLFEIFYPVSIYFLVINSIREEKDVTRFVSYLIASIFLNLMLVFYYFAKYGEDDILLDNQLFLLSFAEGGLIVNLLIMVMPIVIALLTTAQKKSLKLLFYIMIAAGVAGVMVSFARTAQISMILGLLVFLLNKKTRRQLILFIVAGMLVFIFNSERLEPYFGKYKDLTSLESVAHTSSLEKRYTGWKAALEMFRDHPLTGVGIGRYYQEYANYAPQYYAVYARGYVSMISAHNLYLNYLAETGMQGLLLLLTIFSIILAKGVRLIKKGGSNLALKYSLLISVLIFLVNNLVDGITFAYVKEIDKGMVFWSIAAVIMSYGLVRKNQGGNHLPEAEVIQMQSSNQDACPGKKRDST